MININIYIIINIINIMDIQNIQAIQNIQDNEFIGDIIIKKCDAIDKNIGNNEKIDNVLESNINADADTDTDTDADSKEKGTSNINIIDFDPKILDLLNTYMEFYNNRSGNKNHMFEGINYKDPTSINHIMAEFYDILYEYNQNSKNSPLINKVYKEKAFIEISKKNIYNKLEQSFCLKCNNKSYYSYSLMSLIKLVAINKPKIWVIHALK